MVTNLKFFNIQLQLYNFKKNEDQSTRTGSSFFEIFNPIIQLKSVWYLPALKKKKKLIQEIKKLKNSLKKKLKIVHLFSTQSKDAILNIKKRQREKDGEKSLACLNQSEVWLRATKKGNQ